MMRQYVNIYKDDTKVPVDEDDDGELTFFHGPQKESTKTKFSKCFRETYSIRRIYYKR